MKDGMGTAGKSAPGGPTVLNMVPPVAAKPRPSSVNLPASNQIPQGPEQANVIEHNKKDYKGNTVTKRYAKGALLGKGGFAKCYQVSLTQTEDMHSRRLASTRIHQHHECRAS